jgi:glutamate formiminotransferase
MECVPNFSEGRDLSKIDVIAAAISSVPGTLLLDRTSDWDHHRSVITFAGSGDSVVDSALKAVEQAARSIDLTQHRGVHPRVGATDVLPFVPLGGGVTLADCARLARTVGQRIVRELGIPVYLYGEAALRPDRYRLENVRRGQFEGLREAAITDPRKAPDLGGPALHPTAGAVIVGARKILIALNINLQTTDVTIAKAIARRVRESSGGFPFVKALGLPLVSRGLVQVSMNLTDFEQTPPHVVFDEVARLAARHGIDIAESELIGLLPMKAAIAAFEHHLRMPTFNSQLVIESRIATVTGASRS